MRSPHGWLTGGVLALTLTAGAETPTAQAHDNQTFDYYSFDAVTDATATSAQGINARGEIVGSYTKGGVTHGFLWSTDVLTTIDYPGAMYSDARGINAQRDIVGSYRMPGEPAVNFHGYLLSRHGDISHADFPGHTNTIPQRITAAGLILGCRHDGDLMSTMRGIMLNAKDPSESVDIAAFASMNNGASPDGQLIVGLYTEMDTNRGRGYLLYGGTDFVPFDVPGSISTAAWDVSTSGEVVGVYRDAGNLTHGFVWSSLQFANVDVPGALATRAFGINARGTIVGNYTDARNRVHGFVAVRRPVN
jgi:probable HAF family extracellular repeat protein